MAEQVYCSARPSLALIKYWGKAEGPNPNLPATTSLAITLDSIESQTFVKVAENKADTLSIAGENQESRGMERYFENLHRVLEEFIHRSPDIFVPEVQHRPYGFQCTSTNTFPTAAGLASSASGFAALTGACIASVIRPDLQNAWIQSLRAQEKLLRQFSFQEMSLQQAAESLNSPDIDPGEIGLLPDSLVLSSLSRVGSGSASRSVFGGFTLFPAQSPIAFPVAGPDHWPELRVILLRISTEKKPVSSREAMNLTRDTSPFYAAWIKDAPELADQALVALGQKNLDQLGSLMGNSYLRMFSTMFAAHPPVIYWLPESLKAIHLCSNLRTRGIPAWETMDAGPQVKIITVEDAVPAILDELSKELPLIQPLVSKVGKGLDFSFASEIKEGI